MGRSAGSSPGVQCGRTVRGRAWSPHCLLGPPGAAGPLGLNPGPAGGSAQGQAGRRPEAPLPGAESRLFFGSVPSPGGAGLAWGLRTAGARPRPRGPGEPCGASGTLTGEEGPRGAPVPAMAAAGVPAALPRAPPLAITGHVRPPVISLQPDRGSLACRAEAVLWVGGSVAAGPGRGGAGTARPPSPGQWGPEAVTGLGVPTRGLLGAGLPVTPCCPGPEAECRRAGQGVSSWGPAGRDSGGSEAAAQGGGPDPVGAGARAMAFCEPLSAGALQPQGPCPGGSSPGPGGPAQAAAGCRGGCGEGQGRVGEGPGSGARPACAGPPLVQ